MHKKERYKLFIDYFSKHLPKAETELKYENTFHLLIAVILSAQCTDKRVNMITPPLFKKYPTPQSMAKATYEDIFSFIRSCSYPNSKSHYLVDMSKMLVERFNGNMPSNIDELQQLPGVGRKSANVMAAVAFNKPAMPVDTHVHRVSQRIGLVINSKSVLDTEKQLVKNIAPEMLNLAHHWLILHGRYVCQARKPKCEICGIRGFCKYYEKIRSLKSV